MAKQQTLSGKPANGNVNGANVGFEDKLWKAADKLRNNMDAAEYKHVVLGLIFLKYISDAFIECYEELKRDPESDPEETLADNQSAKDVLGDKTLMAMAKELVDTIHRNVKVDWTMRESVQANLRIEIRRLLKRYKYPPDLQQKATDTVLEQAKEVAKDWAETQAK